MPSYRLANGIARYGNDEASLDAIPRETEGLQYLRGVGPARVWTPFLGR